MNNRKDHSELVRELEEDIEVLEEGLNEVEDTAADGEIKEKQEKAHDLLKEIHQQLDYLKDAAEKDKE